MVRSDLAEIPAFAAPHIKNWTRHGAERIVELLGNGGVLAGMKKSATRLKRLCSVAWCGRSGQAAAWEKMQIALASTVERMTI
jgi:hypothetical protein